MDIGAQLRTAREAHGLSLATMAQRTRVQPRILSAIEANDLASIPPRPFGRGFIRSYAREVGLDPDRTVHDYFGQFPPVVHVTPPPAPSYEAPRSSSWFVPLASVTLLTVLIALSWTGREPATGSAAAPEAIGTSGSGTPLGAIGQAIASPPAASREPGQAAPSELDVVLTLNDDSWITATADGNRMVYRLMAAGARETLRARRDVTVLAGNAGAVTLTINGRPAGPIGKPGEVRTIRITPANAAAIGRPKQP